MALQRAYIHRKWPKRLRCLSLPLSVLSCISRFTCLLTWCTLTHVSMALHFQFQFCLGLDCKVSPRLVLAHVLISTVWVYGTFITSQKPCVSVCVCLCVILEAYNPACRSRRAPWTILCTFPWEKLPLPCKIPLNKLPAGHLLPDIPKINPPTLLIGFFDA